MPALPMSAISTWRPPRGPGSPRGVPAARGGGAAGPGGGGQGTAAKPAGAGGGPAAAALPELRPRDAQRGVARALPAADGAGALPAAALCGAPGRGPGAGGGPGRPAGGDTPRGAGEPALPGPGADSGGWSLGARKKNAGLSAGRGALPGGGGRRCDPPAQPYRAAGLAAAGA